MSSSINAPDASTFGTQLAVGARVIMAVMIRETKTRYGSSQLGYLMAIIEPSLFIGVFIAIRGLIGRSTPFGEDLVLFILTGLLTYRIAIVIVNRLTGSFKGNRALLAYPPVKPVDILFARLILEVVTMFCIYAMFFGGMAFFSERQILVRPENLLAAFLATSFLGGGFGFFNGALIVLFPEWRIFWMVIRLPLLLLSGVFFVPSTIPEAYQPFIQWNPLLHCIEWVRTGVYLTYEPVLDKGYPLIVGLVFAVLGLWLERLYRYKMLNA